jgi:hypothetical protein
MAYDRADTGAGTGSICMIDYFFLFPDEAAAIADPVLAPFHIAVDPVGWRCDFCFPNMAIVTPQAVVHGINPNTGFWIMVARNTPINVMGTHANLVLALDRDAANAGGTFVRIAALAGVNRTTATMSVLPAGANYPQPLGQ